VPAPIGAPFAHVSPGAVKLDELNAYAAVDESTLNSVSEYQEIGNVPAATVVIGPADISAGVPLDSTTVTTAIELAADS
jgi:hypothetical protein